MSSPELMEEWVRRSLRERRHGLSSGRSLISEDSPRFLYKYRPLNASDDESVRKLKSLLIDDRVWMASPSSLNDPQDLDFTLEENRNAKERRSWTKNSSALLSPMPPAKRMQFLRQIERARMTSEQIASFKAHQRRELGVFCASQNPRQMQMWTHYADESRGICIQYSTYEEEMFLLARSVIYANTFPTITVPTPIGREQDHYLVKALTWKYEAEWRVVAPIQSCFIQLGRRAISGVILGARASEATRTCIAQLLAERVQTGKPPFSIYQSTNNIGRFGISIRRLDPNTVMLR
ncbi:hypothetical protein CY658_05755 [Variovorax sp. RO1]|uniref:DUF2971 domain-containing protein n=1 Tax=Variovorax sp. RO1 TaxID=2066034 RepID=UPI000CBC527C|nr:DUF2971 domain-containing protein [Variovorax sp. RO1]PLC06530.1 hypothetical protein CY658_05755 [Variovorax sp. RO1]